MIHDPQSVEAEKLAREIINDQAHQGRRYREYYRLQRLLKSGIQRCLVHGLHQVHRFGRFEIERLACNWRVGERLVPSKYKRTRGSRISGTLPRDVAGIVEAIYRERFSCRT